MADAERVKSRIIESADVIEKDETGVDQWKTVKSC